MADDITRRRFLRDSAIVSSAAAIAACDPRWFPRRPDGGMGPGAGMGGAGMGGAGTGGGMGGAGTGGGGTGGGGGMDPGGTSPGPFAQPIYGDAGGIVRWERLGGDCFIELQAEGILLSTQQNTPHVISLLNFELGEGHEDIVAHFGPATLAQLRRELSFPTFAT